MQKSLPKTFGEFLNAPLNAWGKCYFPLDGIIKGVDLGRFPEPNSSTYCFCHFDQVIFVFIVVEKLFPVVTLWNILFKSLKSSFQLLPCGIFCSKPVMLNLVKEVPCFCLVIFFILSTLYVSLINLNSFIVIELSPTMNVLSAEIHFL